MPNGVINLLTPLALCPCTSSMEAKGVGAMVEDGGEVTAPATASCASAPQAPMLAAMPDGNSAPAALFLSWPRHAAPRLQHVASSPPSLPSLLPAYACCNGTHVYGSNSPNLHINGSQFYDS